MRKIFWFPVQTVTSWNILIQTPRIWSWKDVGFLITDEKILKRLDKFANFKDFKSVIEREFEQSIEQFIRFERGFNVEQGGMLLVDLLNNDEIRVENISDANNKALQI